MYRKNWLYLSEGIYFQNVTEFAKISDVSYNALYEAVPAPVMATTLTY